MHNRIFQINMSKNLKEKIHYWFLLFVSINISEISLELFLSIFCNFTVYYSLHDTSSPFLLSFLTDSIIKSKSSFAVCLM